MGRREIVVVFSDFFRDLSHIESAIQRLRYNKHEVVLIQVLHHDELNFQFHEMTKFIGLENPEELLAQPDDLRRAYLQALGQRLGLSPEDRGSMHKSLGIENL